MKRPFVIHPFLFSIFPILFLFTHNIEQNLLLSDTFIPIGIAFGFTLILFTLFSFIWKNKLKVGIILSLYLFLFFSYGHFYNAIAGLSIGHLNFEKHEYLLSTFCLFFILGVYLTIRTRSHLNNLTIILNIMAAFLILIQLIQIGAYNLKTSSPFIDSNKAKYIGNFKSDQKKISTTRDIYYIILDGYASSSNLKEFYNYDNHEFADYLQDKGFYIASKSRSNYATTYLSLASSLNMKYINELIEIVGIESKKRTKPIQLIRNNKVMQFLKTKNYKFIHFRTWTAPTARNDFADWDIQCGKWNEFQIILIQTTILKLFENDIIRDDERERVLCNFSKLVEVKRRIKGPRFVFAHIMVPHPPYLFGPNGEEVKLTKLERKGDIWRHKEAYIDQLMFVNKKIKMFVDNILFKADISPIIILQADHGTASSGGWDKPSERLFKERMGILNAYYLPNGGTDLLYDSITPVNTFRLILNHYFDTPLELLTDESYFSDYNKPYKFIDVTDILVEK